MVTEPGAAAIAVARSHPHAALRDYWALTKPEVNVLIVITTLAGFYLGDPDHSHHVPFVLLVHTLLGTLLVASGAGTLNQFVERHFDSVMRRTSRRPLPSGRVRAVGGSAVRTRSVINWRRLVGHGGEHARERPCSFDFDDLLISVYAAQTHHAALYSRRRLAGSYAPAHRLGRGIGEIEPGGIHTLRNAVPLAISSLHGHRMDVSRRLRPGRLPDSARRRAEALFHGRADLLVPLLALVPLSLIPTLRGHAGVAYVVGALVLGAGFLYFGVQLVLRRSNLNARRLLFASIVYLPLVFVLMVLDKR